MVSPARLSREAVAAEPYLVWNAFVDLLAMSAYEDLSPNQRLAHLAFWYDSEVQNGGHLQYLQNQGLTHALAAIEALRALGATDSAEVLASATKRYQSQARPDIASAEDYAEVALQGEFEEYDSQFHESTVPLQEHLERFLESHLSDFVVLT